MARTNAPATAGSPATPRQARRPVGTADRLEILNKDPNRVYRLVNADPSRMNQFERGGWRLENMADHIGGSQRVEHPTVVDNALMVGGGKNQVLYSIEKELYDEDQILKKARIDDIERSLKPKNSDGMYGDLQITNR